MSKKDNTTTVSPNHNSVSTSNKALATEKAPLFPFLFRRFFEYLIVSVIVSAPLETLRIVKASDSMLWSSRLAYVALAVFLGVSIYFLRAFFFSMGNKSVYFRVNILAYSMYAVINIVLLHALYAYDMQALYSFMFMPTEAISYVIFDIFKPEMGQGIYRLTSAISTHVLMYLVIFAAPMEMYALEKHLNRRSK